MKPTYMLYGEKCIVWC